MEFTPSSTTAGSTAAATATRELPVVQSEPKNGALQGSPQRKYNMPDKNGWYVTDRGTTDMGYWYPEANKARVDERGDEIEALRASSHAYFRYFSSITFAHVFFRSSRTPVGSLVAIARGFFSRNSSGTSVK